MIPKKIKKIFINQSVKFLLKIIIFSRQNNFIRRTIRTFSSLEQRRGLIWEFGANFFDKFLKKNLPLIYLLLFIIFVYSIFDYSTYHIPVSKNIPEKYNIFTAEPLILGSASVNLYGMDTRAKKIEGVFRAYNCPMTGTGEYIVEQADKNGIPYWIVPAISFQESLCGKYTPNKGGMDTYNAWGWAVYGNSAKAFNSYEHGIKVVSEYLSQRFFKRGITETCDIMKIYTPPSKGSWCRGVNYFGEKIQNYITK